MITGSVNRFDEAIVTLRVRRPGGPERVFEFVIDTGSDGFLTLPSAAIRDLRLTHIARAEVTLANGSRDLFDVFVAEVYWDGEWRLVELDQAESEPLIGMMMLRGYSLYLEATQDGGVLVERLR